MLTKRAKQTTLPRERLAVVVLVFLLLVVGGHTGGHQPVVQAFSCGSPTTTTTGRIKTERVFFRWGQPTPHRDVNLLSSRSIQQDNGGTGPSSSSSSSTDNNDISPTILEPIRSRLRQITGFSFTAFRATMRAATGISMTAVYASTLAFTGQWVRQSMKVILSIVPAWARYFIQPLLILYYLPLFTLRNLTGPNRRRGFAKPHALVDGWNQAIVTADSESLALWEVDDDDDDVYM